MDDTSRSIIRNVKGPGMRFVFCDWIPLSLHFTVSGYGIRFLPPRDVGNFGNLRIYGYERLARKFGMSGRFDAVGMGMKWMHKDDIETNENSTKQTNWTSIRQISKPTILAEELKHCHNESTNWRKQNGLVKGHRLTRIRKTVKVDDILCLLESEREARRLR